MRRQENQYKTSVSGFNDPGAGSGIGRGEDSRQQENTIPAYLNNASNRSNNTQQDQAQQTTLSLLPVTTTNTTATTTTSNIHSSPNVLPAKSLFLFQSRAKSTTPTTQLSSRITSSRTVRKTVFLDRLRKNRRDDQADRAVEGFEKAEYWAERRMRERELAREAKELGVELGNEELEVELMEEERDKNDGMSPVEEDREVEELVEGYFSHCQDQSKQDQGGRLSFELNDDDEMGYEEAFMEVLSQEQGGQRPSVLEFGQQSFEMTEREDGQYSQGQEDQDTMMF